MNATTRNIVIGVIIVIILALLGYFAWQERQGSPGSASSTSTSTAATSTGAAINVGTSTSGTSISGGYTITQISGTATPAAPNYKTPLTLSSDVSAADQAQYQSEFTTIQTTLASSPTDYGSWIDLGILRKETGDYTGAAADWKYVTEIYPTDPTAYADLGDLYANDLNQPAQGEGYYKQAIALDPTQQESFYENLAEIYEAQGDTADAKATLQEGIDAKVVGYQNLQNDLDSIK